MDVGVYTVFATLPNDETVAIRKLPVNVSTDCLKSALELLTGVDGDVTQLTLGQSTLRPDQELYFGKTIQPGALLKQTITDPSLLELYTAVCESDVQRVLVKTAESNYYSLFATLVACKRGNTTCLRTLIKRDEEGYLKTARTRFGHTLAHVASSSDQSDVLALLIYNGFPLHIRDKQNRSPLDIAIVYGAYTCERLLARNLYRRMFPEQVEDTKTSGKHHVLCSNKTSNKMSKVTDSRSHTTKRSPHSRYQHKTPHSLALSSMDAPVGYQNRTTSSTQPEFSALPSSTPAHNPEVSITDKERALQRRSGLMRQYTKVKGTTLRAQSAKYYRTAYHLEMEADSSLPKPRPATAGPRYREWKVWLLEKLEQQLAEDSQQGADAERRQRNELEYNKWLQKHGRTSSSVESDSDSEEEDEEENDKAYEKWKLSKQQAFRDLDDKRRRQLNTDGTNEKSSGRQVTTIFELGAHSETVVPKPNAESNLRAFHTWTQTKNNYENWRKRKGLPAKQTDRVDLNKIREKLHSQGMTYHEWLGLKYHEQNEHKN